MLKKEGKITTEGQAVLDAARRAGFELIEAGAMCPDTLHEISEPLIAEDEY